MSSIHDLNQKLILFAGRPSDSRKGLALFLEAVEILTGLTGLPSFAVWIVGGSEREIRLISSLIDRVKSLDELRRDGCILIWGRVENSALSEIYSRASITVIPSHRDEFGIVAVEAMMSGCPVVAANTGGLADVIANGQTGTLFEPDDALTLAATLCTYLRNQQQRDVYGAEARRRAEALFPRQKVLNRVAQLYASRSSTRDIALGSSSFQRPELLTSERLSRLKAILGSGDIAVSQQTKGRHPVFFVEVGTSRFIAKFFTPRFSLQASLFPYPTTLSSERGGQISYKRELYNRENPIAPTIRFHEETNEPLIVTEWLRPLKEPVSEKVDEAIARTLLVVRNHKPLPASTELTNYLDALACFAENPNGSNLELFDLASARLNSPMTGGRLTLCRTHPQVELLRFRRLVSRNTWPLPLEFRTRVNQAIGLLVEKQEIILDTPRLAHGDPKPEHLLIDADGKISIADFEHSRYAVGPCDLALWFSFTGVRGRLDTNAADVCDRVCQQCSTWQERYLCICWIVSEVIFFALHRLASGERQEVHVTQNFLRDLPMVLLNREIIR